MARTAQGALILSYGGGYMGDLTIHDYTGLSEEELSRVLQEERTKMFGADAAQDWFSEGPITLYSHHDRDPKE